MFNIKEVDAGDVYHKIANTAGLRLIDVRSEGEVAQGAIPGAVHIPLHLLPMRVHEISDDAETIIYCRSGMRSAQACAFLQAQGKRNVFNMRGGIIAWVQNGLAVA
ncbi:MAG: rhodanese-like domain-containing protein [Gammaproteobacteria bacterium]|nr:rhodanese-like domain-containing protein [Gammaproteobacteria bacterium]